MDRPASGTMGPSEDGHARIRAACRRGSEDELGEEGDAPASGPMGPPQDGWARLRMESQIKRCPWGGSEDVLGEEGERLVARHPRHLERVPPLICVPGLGFGSSGV